MNGLPRILYFGIAALLVFTPLAFGSVEVWAASILEAAAFVLLGLFMAGYGITRESEPAGLPAVPVGLFALVLVWAAAQWISSRSADPHATRSAFLLGTAYLSVFVVTASVPMNEKSTGRLIQGLLVLGFGIGMLAILQLYAWNGKIYWLRPVRQGMAYGPFINRNHLAGYLELLIPAGVGFLIANWMEMVPRGARSRTRWIDRVTDPRASRLALAFFMLFIMAVALVLTLSRSGIVGFLSAMFLIGVAMAAAGRTRRWIALPAVLLALILLSLVWFGMEPVIQRLVTLRDPAHVPAMVERLKVWKDAWRIVSDHPLSGTGLGTFGTMFPSYKTFPAPFHYDHAHNDYIELAADSGWAGFAAAMAGLVIFSAGILRGFGRRRPRVRILLLGLLAGLLAFLAHGLTDFNFHIPSNALLFTVLAALAWRLSRDGEGIGEATGRTGRWRKPLGAAGLGLTGFLLYLSVSTGLGDAAYRAGLENERSGRLEKALDDYGRARGWDTGNPLYRFASARVHEREWDSGHSGEALESAEADLLAAVDLSPFVAEYRIHLGWVYAQMAHDDQAAAQFSRGLALDPTNANWGHYAGLWFASTGRKELALKTARDLDRLGFRREAEDIQKRL